MKKDSGPFKVGQFVKLKSPANRYYIKHSTTFPTNTKGEIIGFEYDEHLSSRGYCDCWLYEIKNDNGDTGWFTDLDIKEL